VNETLTKSSKVIKVDEALGLVFGFAIVCKNGDEPYFDTQGDHIPEDTMLKSVTDFMENSRVQDDMHDEAPDGKVVFSFPLTKSIAESLGIETDQTGWLVGIKPSAEIFDKFKNGERTGFSIGGYRGEDEEVIDE
jgi:hypothetical protein